MSRNGVTPNGTAARTEAGQLPAPPEEAEGAEGAEEAGFGPDELHTLCAHAAELVGRLPGRLRRVALRGTDHAVEIEWHEVGAVAAVAAGPIGPADAGGGAGLHPGLHPPAGGGPADGGSAADGGSPADAHVIAAPLVGTFYRAPEPGAAPFVEVGDHVEPGQTVGIVEAMKLMNPVTAETAGRIGAIYVGNGEPVEFDQPLVRVDADAGAASGAGGGGGTGGGTGGGGGAG
jgi:acetyl-CoA carboxylase biotin carboxyl carrier protein